MTHKPAKNHPWRVGPSLKAMKWAKEESYIRPFQNFSKGSFKGLKEKHRYKEGAL